MAGLQSVSAKDRVTEMEDSVQLIKARFDSLKEREKQLRTEIQNLVLDTIVSQDTVNHMTARLESLRDKWKSLNYENDELKKVTVTDEDIAKINNNIDQYQISFVQMASAFLYIPYSKGAVEKIAKPAFDQSEGSSYYDDYSIILKLLQNYETDTNQLQGFIDSAMMAIKDLSKSNTKTPLPPQKEETDTHLNGTPDLLSNYGNTPDSENDRNNKSEEQNKNKNKKDKNLEKITNKFRELRKNFNDLSCVKDYKAYGDGWEDTYLGEIIKGIEKDLYDKSYENNLDKLYNIFNGYLVRLQ